MELLQPVLVAAKSSQNSETADDKVPDVKNNTELHPCPGQAGLEDETSGKPKVHDMDLVWHAITLYNMV